MALVLSIAGLMRDKNKLLALVTLLISGAFALLVLMTRGDVLSITAALAR